MQTCKQQFSMNYKCMGPNDLQIAIYRGLGLACICRPLSLQYSSVQAGGVKQESKHSRKTIVPILVNSMLLF